MQEDKRRTERHDLAIKVRINYPTRDAFTTHFSDNLSEDGIFIRAKSPPEVGSRIRVEYTLTDGTNILKGTGIVRWVRHPSGALDPSKPPGMGVQLLELDDRGRDVFKALIARRGAVIPSWLSAIPEQAGPLSDKVTTPAPNPDAFADDLPAPVAGADSLLVGESAGLDRKSALLIDLSGTDLLGALAIEKDGRVEAVVPSSTTPRFVADEEGVHLHPNGVWVPCLMQLLGCAWPSPRATVLGRRFGLALTNDSQGRVALRLEREIVSVADALSACLRDLIEPYGNSELVPRTTRVILPTSASPLALELVGQCLQGFGYSETKVIVDAYAAATASGLALQSAKPALVIQANLLEMRLALVRGKNTEPVSRAACDTGLWRADELLVDKLALALLEQRKSLPADLALWRRDLLLAITSARTESPASGAWQMSFDDVPHELLLEDVARHLQPITDRVLLACEELLAECAVRPQDLQMILLSADEPLWPGLAESLNKAFKHEPTVSTARAWHRINGAALLVARERR